MVRKRINGADASHTSVKRSMNRGEHASRSLNEADAMKFFSLRSSISLCAESKPRGGRLRRSESSVHFALKTGAEIARVHAGELLAIAALIFAAVSGSGCQMPLATKTSCGDKWK